jgi:hypothetical protein
MYSDMPGGGKPAQPSSETPENGWIAILLAVVTATIICIGCIGCTTIKQPTTPIVARQKEFVFHPLKPKPSLPKVHFIAPKDKGAAVALDRTNLNLLVNRVQTLEQDDNYARDSFNNQVDAYHKCITTGKGCQ